MLRDVGKGAGREPLDLLQRAKKTRVARRMYCLLRVGAGCPRTEGDKTLDHILVWHSMPCICSHTLTSVCWLFSLAAAPSLSSHTQSSEISIQEFLLPQFQKQKWTSLTLIDQMSVTFQSWSVVRVWKALIGST